MSVRSSFATLLLAFAVCTSCHLRAQCLPAPALSIRPAPLSLELHGAPSHNYAIEHSFDLQAWERLTTNRSASGSFVVALSGGSPTRFYRSLEVQSLDGRGAFWLFDGQTTAGWIPDAAFRVENCAFVGGSLASAFSVNRFICTSRPFTNFILRLKFKLAGVDGLINSGVQFRSVRNADATVSGYQADIGDGFWGSLYDERRRNVVLAAADQAAVRAVLKLGDWNEYRIWAEGPRIRLFLNGLPTVDFVESSQAIPQHGIVALQVHQGARMEASFKEISIEEL